MRADLIDNNIERLRTWVHKARQALRLKYWFPHVPLAFFMMVGGVLLLRSDLRGSSGAVAVNAS